MVLSHRERVFDNLDEVLILSEGSQRPTDYGSGNNHYSAKTMAGRPL
jgi:ABC-type protease/lipase transport system fused ATPase/permease subunit